MNKERKFIGENFEMSKNPFKHFLDLKFEWKLLIYLSPVILFWILALVNIVADSVRLGNEFNFLNNFIIAVLCGLAFLPIISASVFYVIAEKIQKPKVSIVCLPILCFHIVSTIAGFYGGYSLITYLFAKSFLGILMSSDAGYVISLIVLSIFWVLYTTLVVFFFISVINKIKKQNEKVSDYERR